MFLRPFIASGSFYLPVLALLGETRHAPLPWEMSFTVSLCQKRTRFLAQEGTGAALTCILFFSLLSWLCIQFPESSLASSHRHDRAKGRETEWKKGAGGGSAKVYLWKWFVSMATRGSWKMDLQCNSNQPHLVEFVLYYCSYRRALVDSGKLAVQCLVERTVVKSFSRPIIMHSSDVMDLS